MSNRSMVFDPTTFPVLTTERLTLREPLHGDATDYFIVGRDPEVQKYNAPIDSAMYGFLRREYSL